MLDNKRPFWRKMFHLLAEVGACIVIPDRQPYDVHSPLHEVVQDRVLIPKRDRIDWIGETQSRAVLRRRYHLVYSFACSGGIKPKGSGSAEELRRIADAEHRLKANAEHADLAGSALTGHAGEHERCYPVSVNWPPLVGTVEEIAGETDHDASAVGGRQGVGTVLNQLEELTTGIAATRDGIFGPGIFLDSTRLFAIGVEGLEHLGSHPSAQFAVRLGPVVRQVGQGFRRPVVDALAGAGWKGPPRRSRGA